MTRLEEYIYEEIVPRYASFDPAHRQEHVLTVINESMRLLDFLPSWLLNNAECELVWRQRVDRDVLLTAAACHDLGLINGRDNHHMDSGVIIRNDSVLREFFSNHQIEIIAQAAEDHRASGRKPPRSIYGMLVAEADRVIDPDTIILRTLQFGFQHYPELDKEGHMLRASDHLRDKYGKDGYLRLWVPWSDNSARLSVLREIISDDELLRYKLNVIYNSIFED